MTVTGQGHLQKEISALLSLIKSSYIYIFFDTAELVMNLI